MTEEHQGVIDLLQRRLGMRLRTSIDDGRNQIIGVLRDEMKLGRDEAEAHVRQLLDSGTIRYVTGDERDVDTNDAGGNDGRARIAGSSDDEQRDDGMTDRRDNLIANAIPSGGGPQQGASGLTAGAAAPLVAGGLTTSPGLPLAAGVDIGASSDELQSGGYWDFGAGQNTVVPSESRKGQVEPSNT